MRIAFISDIHANLVAFEAVLRDIDEKKPDEIVFLGDAATLGPQPRAVMAELRKLGPRSVLGNHDGFMLDHNTAPELVSNWYADQLTGDDVDFLRTFRPTIELELDPDNKILCYHGSPASNTDQILPATPADRLEGYLDGSPGPVFIGGHTHIQMMKQFKGRTVINAGSVGMPFESVPFPETAGPRFLPWAEYTILHWDSRQTGVELRKIPLDMDAVFRSYTRSTMPEALYWWNLWLAD
ncbi:MAG TPA: metallophosphoesterase family protein [Anaerolineales bacterium]|nr:metallophosphoesterase family protein [Anaerolineales bacterium]